MTLPVDRGRAVIVMAKRPAPGVTKTRLSPTLTPAQAAELYERLLLDTIDAIERRTDCTTVIAIDQPESTDYFAAIAPDIEQVEQLAPGDSHAELGDRLNTVLTACLARGFSQVFAVGSDSPDLPPTHVDEAFAAFDNGEADVVLGPTEDGGYYLIGWKQRWPAIVREVQMSTPSVLDDTLAIADRVGARVALISPWYDVDTPGDLARIRSSVTDSPSHTAAFLADL